MSDPDTPPPSDPDTPPEADDALRPNSLGLVRLEALCQLLGMSYAVARRKQSLGQLPVKAFRLSGRRGPLYVHFHDLERLVARRRARGTPAHPGSK